MGRVEHLEQLRQAKAYQQVLTDLTTNRIDDSRMVPIGIDSARGLVKRSVSPAGIATVHSELMTVTYRKLSDRGYVELVDQDPTLTISHRRDLSRYFWEVAPALSTKKNQRENSFSLLESANSFAAKDGWQESLIVIEEQNKTTKFGQRVNIDDTLIALGRVLESQSSNQDVTAAVVTWSTETVLSTAPQRVADVVRVAEKAGVAVRKMELIKNAAKRLAQEKIREGLIELRGNELSRDDKKTIDRQLTRIARAW